ncbi:hypothetical protein SAMN02745174_02612 [Cetobacterium ceti]|uniref:Uncharacterized protein n=1 Tax=Cetobacterium ceti TaxID=180163 RepID=A0A1T4R7N0_9FUSO|nr:hypothetical protein [Cetobacterium ceti]SKA12072.1 hypothetical protein SAMN02745174_02612 [Cetobacterium ceti]
MEKPLKFKEIVIPYPNLENTYTDYNRKLQPKMDFESEYLKEFYLTHKDNLIETTIKKCEEYLDMDDWMEEETFPRIKDLTGEWYLASVIMRNEDKKIVVQLYLHFLGYYSNNCIQKEIDDYLGMEAWFVYDPTEKTFSFDGFNTDAI